MRQSGCGAASSDPSTRESCDSVTGAWVDAGMWMKFSIRINGTTHYLWRAVDQHGQVVDILVQTRRDRAAAERFFRLLLKDKCGASHCDYRSAPQLFGCAAAGAAQSQTPTRALAEQSGGEFTSTHTRTGTAHASIQIVQASAAIPVCSRNRQLSFPTPRHRLTAARYRAVRRQRFRLWNTAVRAKALELAF